jgi:hypothetical protein
MYRWGNLVGLRSGYGYGAPANALPYRRLSPSTSHPLNLSSRHHILFNSLHALSLHTTACRSSGLLFIGALPAPLSNPGVYPECGGRGALTTGGATVRVSCLSDHLIFNIAGANATARLSFSFITLISQSLTILAMIFVTVVSTSNHDFRFRWFFETLL